MMINFSSVSESQFVRIPVAEERKLAKTEQVIDRIKEQLENEELRRRYSGKTKTITEKALQSVFPLWAEIVFPAMDSRTVSKIKLSFW